MVYVENLTPVSAIRALFFARQKSASPKQSRNVFYIDGTLFGLMLCQCLGQIFRISVEKLDFDFFKIRDDDGAITGFRLVHEDMLAMEKNIINSRAFRSLYNDKWSDNLLMFLRKSVATTQAFDRMSLFRTLYLIQVVAWHKKTTHNSKSYLFMTKRCWMECISEYSNSFDINLVAVRNRFDIRCFIKDLNSKFPKIRFYIKGIKRLVLFKQEKLNAMSDPIKAIPKIAVESNVFLQIEKKENYSCLFFWQLSELEGKNIMVYGTSAVDPFNTKNASEFTKEGMHLVAMSEKATQISEVPVFSTPFKTKVAEYPGPLNSNSAEFERKHIESQINVFNSLKCYWYNFFYQHGIKVNVLESKWDFRHIAMTEAMEELGGVSSIWQVSYEEFPSTDMIASTDIFFGFSPHVAEIDKINNSRISYDVAIGYPGGHFIPLLRDQANELRLSMQKKGARKIISYFDENSIEDKRWRQQHYVMRENYQFLLEKVLSEPWLGLILKPKKPGSLLNRLGPVAKLLEEAIKTGRCHALGMGGRANPFPPIGAAMSSDVTIHSHLYAGTAGLEAALAGVPSILLDRDGWKTKSLFTKKGLFGKVVFSDLDTVWRTLKDHWNSEVGVPGLGDWSPILDLLDPFQDGKAGERMGTYLNWIIKGFEDGLDKQTILADAAERYCKRWGRDKITAVSFEKPLTLRS